MALDIKAKMKALMESDSEDDRLKISAEIIEGYEGDNDDSSEELEKLKLDYAKLEGRHEQLQESYKSRLFGGDTSKGQVDEREPDKEEKKDHKSLSQLGF